MDHSAFKKYLATMSDAPIIAVDTETTGLRVREGEDYLMGISVSYRWNGDIWSAYFPFRHESDNLPKESIFELSPILEVKTLVFANVKFDFASLHSIGITPKGDFFDVQIMAHLLDENIPSKKLDFLGKTYLKTGKLDKDKIDAWAKIWGYKTIPVSIMEEYAKRDAEVTLKLFEKFYEDMK